jgi:hypothetical protein
MKKHTERNTSTTTAQHSAATIMPPLRAHPDWKPQPCGLSREELRKIVAEILG